MIQAGSDLTAVEQDREVWISQINELATAFEQVQDTIQANAKLYEQKMDDYEEDIENLKAEIDKQIIEIMTRDNDIKELKASLANAKSSSENEELVSLREEISNLMIEIDELKEEMILKDETMGKLSASINAKDTDITAKTNEIEKLKDALEKVQDEKNSTNEEIYNLMEQVQKLEHQEQLLRDELETSNAKIRANDYEIESLKGTITQLQGDLDALRDCLRSTEKRLEEKEFEWAAEKTGIIATMKKTLEEVEGNARKEKEISSKENSVLSMKLDEVKSKLLKTEENYERMIKDFEDRLNEVDRDEIKLRKEIIDVRAKSYKEKMDLRVTMETKEKLLGDKVKDLTQKLGQYEADRRSLRKLSSWAVSRLGSILTFRKKKG